MQLTYCNGITKKHTFGKIGTKKCFCFMRHACSGMGGMVYGMRLVQVLWNVIIWLSLLVYRSLATVPDLIDICIRHIVSNFEGELVFCFVSTCQSFVPCCCQIGNPLLDELKPKHKAKVLEMLATSIPLR